MEEVNLSSAFLPIRIPSRWQLLLLFAMHKYIRRHISSEYKHLHGWAQASLEGKHQGLLNKRALLHAVLHSLGKHISVNLVYSTPFTVLTNHGQCLVENEALQVALWNNQRRGVWLQLNMTCSYCYCYHPEDDYFPLTAWHKHYIYLTSH